MIRLDCRDGIHDACETCDCTCHRPSLDTDRLAASSALLALAETFAIEAKLWRLEEAQRAAQRAARQLAEIGRQALASTPLDIANGYLDAGTTLLHQLQAARRFITAVNHQPTLRPGYG